MEKRKHCDFALDVHSGQETKMPLSPSDFVEIMSDINSKWLETGVALKIQGSEWHTSRGIILCEDEFSREWIKKHVEEMTLEGGKTFKAWNKTDGWRATVKLGMAFAKCTDPELVISKALQSAGIENAKVDVTNVKPLGGERIVYCEFNKEVAKVVKEQGSKIQAGLSTLEFRFK